MCGCSFRWGCGPWNARLSNSTVTPLTAPRTTVNSRGATTTTYLVPVNHLPLTLPLRYLGMSDAEVDQIDSVLQPQIDAAYARNDNWFTRPVSVDPVRGLDPLTAPGSIVEGARGLLGSPAFGG